MIRAVVVGAAGNSNRSAICAVISRYKQISRRLARRVGRGGVNRRFLCKKQVGPVERKVAVNLIRRYLVVAAGSKPIASIEKHLCAQNVCFQKDLRCIDRTIHMALRRKVYNSVKIFLFK